MWFAANNILLMRSCNHALGEKMAGRFGWAVREWFKYKNKLGDRMIKQLSNSVIAKYCDLSMSRRSIICLSLRLRQIIDLLATDKSQYFAQPRPIIVNYFFSQASERAGCLDPRIWLANLTHVTGPAFYDTAHGPDFSRLRPRCLNFAPKSLQ